MRRYIRHPVDIPIEVQEEALAHAYRDNMWNVSGGGLAFCSESFLDIGTLLRLRIALTEPVFEVTSRVAWCHPRENHFEVGVEFMDRNDEYRARMVEQICHIEEYRQKVWKTEGRRLTPNQAAEEWIAKYAASFPPPSPAHDDIN
jgi:hypothetical protein